MMNLFESGRRKVIPAVLIYARCGSEVMMLHRNTQGKKDFHLGKWNGLGGKFEKDESPLEAAVREFYEESGLKIKPDLFSSLGVITFPNFKPKKSEDWCCFIFSVQISKKDRAKKLKSKEGTLHWVPKNKVMDLNLWAGDALFLPYVLDQKPVMGTVWYKGEKVTQSWITLI